MAKEKLDPKTDELPADIAFVGGDGYEDSDLELDGDRGDSIEDGDEPVQPAPEKPSEASQKEEEDEPEAEDEPAEQPEEPAEEPEEEDEPEEQPEEEDPKPQAKDNRIPKERFDQVNQRMKAAEQKLRELEQKTAATDEAAEGKYDFSKAEGEAAEMLLDGRMQEYTAKREEIRAAERAEWLRDATDSSKSTFNVERENEAIEAMASEYQAQYPALDSDNESFDEGLLDEIEAQMIGYQQRGRTRVEAFEKAVQNVVKLNGLDPAQQEAAPPPKASKQAKKPARSVKDKQPPAGTGEHGDRADAAGASQIDVSKMSDDELDALPVSKLREMRGDFY